MVGHLHSVRRDFYEAFDTVGYETLLRKLAQLNIQNCVYNCMLDFFGEHTHCTKFSELTSAFLVITTGVIQGSAVGPATFVVNAADLTRHRSHIYVCDLSIAVIL